MNTLGAPPLGSGRIGTWGTDPGEAQAARKSNTCYGADARSRHLVRRITGGIFANFPPRT
ncbi:hypothetical protein GCM10007079_30140 [Nocardiopsis terrae]|nr:hypothetical protein GCM10007079_30140 [Nocardiopsis terrae]